MSGNNYPKKMQVHLTEAQHQAFKDYAYRSKVSMMECVRGWIGEKCSVDLKVGKVVLAQKPDVKSASVPASVFPKSVEEQKACKHSYVPHPETGQVCFKCGYRP